MNINSLTSEHVRRVLALKEKIEQLESELQALTDARAGKRFISARGRARIAATQKARWAKIGKKADRRRSPAVRAKLAAAARARWRKAKATGKNSL